MNPLRLLFDWKELYRDEVEYILYDVTTKIDIGKFPAGTTFPRVEVHCSSFKITLCEEDMAQGRCRIPEDKMHRFRYRPEITEEIPRDE